VKLSFRLARGAWIALIILVAHAAVAWTFIHMRVRAPELGPVFMMFLDDPRGESAEPDNPPDSSPATPSRPAAPATPAAPAKSEPPADTEADAVPPSPEGEAASVSLTPEVASDR
jgi:hypothetical protein